jgi:hypothetical protein
VTKKQLMDHFDDVVTSRRAARVEQFIADPGHLGASLAGATRCDEFGHDGQAGVFRARPDALAVYDALRPAFRGVRSAADLARS